MSQHHAAPAGAAPTAALPRQVQDLLTALDPEERLALLHQATPAVPRLGLAAFHTGAEVLHGVAWLGTATVYPQAVGLGATWDPDLLRRIGEQVGTELRAKHAADPAVSRNVWAPVVNPLRHPRWGRNEEGLSEDPHLTADLAGGYARGLRGTHEVWRTVPTLKHVLGYNNETDRAVTSSQLPARVLHEYELPAFLGPLQAGVAGALMPAYNLVNGRPCHISGELLEELRRQAALELLVVSDAGAPTNLTECERYFDDPATAHAAALRAGVDSFTDNGQDPEPTLTHLRTALAEGLISQEDVDRAAARVLLTRWRTGELDAAADPYAGTGPDQVDAPEHRALAREAAARATVVLGNDGLLPLTGSGRVLVVGPLADRVLPDWYAGEPPYTVSLADAVRARWAGPVQVDDGADHLRLSTAAGVPVVCAADGQLLAEPGGQPDEWHVTDWGHGLLTVAAAGTGLLWRPRGDGAVRADSPRPHGWVAQEPFRTHRHEDGSFSYLHVASGRWLRTESYGGRVVATAATLAEAERFTVAVVSSGPARARARARDADLVVCAVGNDPHLLGRETEDRPGLALPATATTLWRTVRAEQDDAVLALISSYPYALAPAEAGARGLVWSSHGGQELGHGLLDVLLGEVEPSGRLSQTWWRSEADAGDLLDYDILSARSTYWYSPAEPLFAFGHGLTYSRVVYRELQVIEDGGAHRAQVTLANTGARPATEVVQVYTDAPDHPLVFPRRLAGYTRVLLAPGEEQVVHIDIPPDRFQHWDAGAGAMRTEAGRYRVLAGPSAAGCPLLAEVELAAPPRPERTLPLLAVAADSWHGTRIEEALPERGHVLTVPGGRGRLGFEDVRLPAAGDRDDQLHAAVRLVAQVARTRPDAPAGLRVEILSAAGETLATLAADVPTGTGRHELVDLPLGALPAGEEPVRVQVHLSGVVRLVHLDTQQ
ncbi:glycoside hydrolase family 3 C-terminal domain-containing protein [Ruania albidiflava]|uniref:glycoside hydrolase family 3 C-terminal domain-containing protein n=1 Tax=Ruania albidiflava TaxID=366586 RepID=UPI0003B70828|nr:glycoside hydrolase family 3 C-terminal domain-containing protein [Ruania albidiflava]